MFSRYRVSFVFQEVILISVTIELPKHTLKGTSRWLSALLKKEARQICKLRSHYGYLPF